MRPPQSAPQLSCSSFDLEDLVRRFGPRLLAVARRLVRNEDDARDVVQDGLVAAFRAMGSFQGQSSPETWLHRIVVNTALMKLRARRRRPETSIEELLPAFPRGRPSRDAHPRLARDARGAHGTAARLRTSSGAASTVSPRRHRAILILRDVEELSTEEAAQALGITAGAAKLRLHRARQALRGLLAPFFEAPGKATTSSSRGALRETERGAWAQPVPCARDENGRRVAQ